MILLFLLLAIVSVTSAAYLWPTIAHDGHGVRPGPRSHRLDEFGSPRDI